MSLEKDFTKELKRRSIIIFQTIIIERILCLFGFHSIYLYQKIEIVNGKDLIPTGIKEVYRCEHKNCLFQKILEY